MASAERQAKFIIAVGFKGEEAKAIQRITEEEDSSMARVVRKLVREGLKQISNHSQ